MVDIFVVVSVVLVVVEVVVVTVVGTIVVVNEVIVAVVVTVVGIIVVVVVAVVVTVVRTIVVVVVAVIFVVSPGQVRSTAAAAPRPTTRLELWCHVLVSGSHSSQVSVYVTPWLFGLL